MRSLACHQNCFAAILKGVVFRLWTHPEKPWEKCAKRFQWYARPSGNLLLVALHPCWHKFLLWERPCLQPGSWSKWGLTKNRVLSGCQMGFNLIGKFRATQHLPKEAHQKWMVLRKGNGHENHVTLGLFIFVWFVLWFSNSALLFWCVWGGGRWFDLDFMFCCISPPFLEA